MINKGGPVTTALLVAVLILGTLTVANMLFLGAVTRRLRQHSEVLKSLTVRNESGLLPGASIPTFTTTTTKGDVLGSTWLLDGSALLAFVTTHCVGCRDALPQLKQLLRSESSRKALVVIGGEPGSPFETALEGMATVVVEPELGPVQRAFRVDAFPSFFAVEGGRVIVNTTNVRGLAAGVTSSR